MKEPLISVILPVFNGEKYLSKSIESILRQTINDFELIIVNDGSTDTTETIILSYKDERIRYIKNEQNLKLIKTLNRGIKLSRGQYLSRMDADDIAFPNLFEEQLKIFANFKNVDIVNIRNNILSNDGKYFYKSKSTITVNSEVHQHIVFFQNLISHPGVMVKASLMRNYLYFDHENVTHFEDVDLWYRLLKNGNKCYTINKCLLYYRKTPTGIIHTQRKNIITNRINYIKKILIDDYFPFFDENAIKILLGSSSSANLGKLMRLNKSLAKYILFIKNNKDISVSGLSDLYFWKTNILFVSSINLLRKSKLLKKIGIGFFIILNIPKWLINNKWRKHFFKVIITKKQKFISLS